MRTSRHLTIAACLTLLAACAETEDGSDVDSGTPGLPFDGSLSGPDGGVSPFDAGLTFDAGQTWDAQVSVPDAALPDAGRLDAGGDASTPDAAAQDAGSTDAGASDAGKPDGGATDAGSDAGSTVDGGSAPCAGARPHGCYTPKAGNPTGCPPQIHEQSAFYPPIEEWEACSSPYYAACVYLKPGGGEANCSCDLGLHWLCTY